MLSGVVNTLEVFLNDYKMLYVILGAVALLGINSLSRKIQEWTISKSIANQERQQQIEKNNADMQQIHAEAQKRALKQMGLADDALSQKMQATEAAAQKKANAAEQKAQAKALKNETKRSKEVAIRQKMEKKGISRAEAEREANLEFQDEELAAQQLYQEADAEYQKASQEYNTALQEQKKLQHEIEKNINYTQAERLALDQKSLENNNA